MATKRITLNLSEEAVKAVDELAEADNRSRSKEVDWLIKRARLNRPRDRGSTGDDCKPAPVEEVEATAGIFPEVKERTHAGLEPGPPGSAGSADIFQSDPVTEPREGDET